jgi:hypothetical protein
MKITKRQLRQIIRESMVQSYDLGHEDSLAGIRPQDSDEDYMRGYNEAQMDSGLPEMQPPSDSGTGRKLDPSLLKHAYVASPEDRAEMADYIAKLEKKKSRMSEGTLYVSRSEWDGTMMIEDDQGEYFGFGEMILDLIKSGEDSIFQSDQGVDPENLEKMMQKHEEGVQGGMQRWDNSVFPDYYNVDPDQVLKLYAQLNNHDIQEAPGDPDDDYPDDGTNEFEEYYS